MNADVVNDDNAQDRQTMKNLRTVVLSLVGIAMGLIVAVVIVAYA